MGRSVISHPYATVTAYADFEPDHYTFHCEECEDWTDRDTCPHVGEGDYIPCDSHCDHSEEWSEYVEYVRETVLDMFPSMYAEDSHLHSSEQNVIARNAHSEVSISSYCDSVAISLAEQYQSGHSRDTPSALGEKWRKSVAQRFSDTFSTRTLLARMSDGTSAYIAKGVDV